MPLTAGVRLGHYEIQEPLGAGGMGEVYRARDTKLNRDVAIKILPDAFASDADRVARFTREAQTLATLNHPYIAQIHGFEESPGVRALVMELVEGEDLAQRIARGAIPITEALAIAKQVADGLEAAHDKGIIHRDLKPANIKLTPDGTVKILDFGLAKAAMPEVDAANSPTFTVAATQIGVILGTAAYMSPEQARGKVVDKRADVWAFGCVLYELLTGTRAFTGDNVTDIVAAVVRSEPEWTKLPAGTPSRMRELLRRCLEKEPKRRLRDIGDARLDLEEAMRAADGAPEDASIAHSRRPSVLLWAATAALAASIVAVVATAVALRANPPAPARVVRFSVPIPPGARLVYGSLVFQPALALSPDGRSLAFAVERAGTRQIYVRALDDVDSKPVAGTEGGSGPFFSPDETWLGFFADGQMKRVAVAGGPAFTMASATFARGAAWLQDDTILYTPDINAPLFRVAAQGGAPRQVTTFADSERETTHRLPEILPGDRAALFRLGSATTGDRHTTAVVDLVTGKYRVLLENASNPRYVAGHILYGREGVLYAVPFDPDRLEIHGQPIAMLDNVVTHAYPGVAQIAVSGDGTLAYVPGPGDAAESRPVWMDAAGEMKPAADLRKPFFQFRLSPDGRRAAVDIREGALDIWLLDLTRGSLQRLTTDPGSDTSPIWTPDGKQVTYGHRTGATYSILSKAADGSDSEETLITDQQLLAPSSWSPDGNLLLYTIGAPGSRDIWALTLRPERGPQRGSRVGDSERKTAALTATPFDEVDPVVSPDGRWVAYASNQSGRFEIYVRPFPGPGGTYPVSTSGGGSSRWSGDGRELYYRSGNAVMAVAISARPEFEAGTPRRLFERPLGIGWDVAADGKRFLMMEGVEESTAQEIRVVVNWVEELRARVGGRH